MYQVQSTETTVYIEVSNGGFDVERPEVSRNPKMNVSLVEVSIQDGQPAAIVLRGKAYKGDGTLGDARASADVWPDPGSPPEAGFLAFDILPTNLGLLIGEQWAKYASTPA